MLQHLKTDRRNTKHELCEEAASRKQNTDSIDEEQNNINNINDNRYDPQKYRMLKSINLINENSKITRNNKRKNRIVLGRTNSWKFLKLDQMNQWKNPRIYKNENCHQIRIKTRRKQMFSN